MISDEAVEAAAKAMLAAGNHVGGWEALPVFMQENFTRDARAALEAAAPHMLALLVADLDTWAGRSKTGYYDEAQDDVVQILNPYRSQA